VTHRNTNRQKTPTIENITKPEPELFGAKHVEKEGKSKSTVKLYAHNRPNIAS